MSPTPENRSTLLSRCRKGENKACEELYRLYSRAMFNTCLRIVNIRDEAEDILQESFLKLFQHIRRFEQEPAMAAWLKRTVVNSSIDFVRKKKMHVVKLEEAEDVGEEEPEEEATYDIDSVKNAVTELPDGYRLVLSLYLFEDYSHKEIADMLKISEGTSKSQYNRAKKKLAEIIKQKTFIHEA